MNSLLLKDIMIKNGLTEEDIFHISPDAYYIYDDIVSNGIKSIKISEFVTLNQVFHLNIFDFKDDIIINLGDKNDFYDYTLFVKVISGYIKRNQLTDEIFCKKCQINKEVFDKIKKMCKILVTLDVIFRICKEVDADYRLFLPGGVNASYKEEDTRNKNGGFYGYGKILSRGYK